MTEPLIKIEDLSLGFTARDGCRAPILHRLSLELAPGETLGSLGESGSGKSTVALALMAI
ncbi:ATP-binding cassette domain-containing protein [Leisingera daeponensis]|uniref:ATP-binding cassette domain-containing protein n=1 Tax=Leisingera daeponensis TaxID=405746 RepID=UPI00041EEFBF|nr:ATP-binding cassette domain-containing protein [Leisingera daeponensis]